MLVVLHSREYLDAVSGVVGERMVRAFPRAAPPLLMVDDDEALAARLLAHAGVERVLRPMPTHPLASRVLDPASHTVQIREVTVGGDDVIVIAGPCSAESGAQVLAAAEAVAAAGASLLRGGAFKPRTSPYSFQGLGAPALSMLAAAREATGLPVVTEVLSIDDLELVAAEADVLQVGARNMQNFRLLQALGQVGKPVLLKRGFGCTVDELLSSAEYVLAAGNPDVMLCERGIRTFERGTRFTFDVSAIAALKQRSRLPVLADPSHAAGDRALVPALAKSAIAAGADGLMIEVHPSPQQAESDGAQALSPAAFGALMDELAPLCVALGRRLS